MDANRSGSYAMLFAEQNTGPGGPNRAATGITRLNTGRYRDRIHLTPREREVLGLLAEGLSNKLICRRLNISTGTVKIHVARVLAELRASTRLQAVITAQRLGLLEIQAPGAERAAVTRIDAAASRDSAHTAAEPQKIRLGSGK
jgi:DNA-binding CsgD family transcriptional regulator